MSDDRDGSGQGATSQVDEPFTRYQNNMYRLISMAAAGLIVVLGVLGFAIGRTLDPAPPSSFFLVDGIVAFVLIVWYLLGMRCHLDVGDTWVHVAGKYGDLRLDRDRIESVELDPSMWGAIQWSGRPLLIHYRVDGVAGVRTRRAPGCLPADTRGQVRVVEELQELLGRPERRADDVENPTASVDPALRDAVAARLAAMRPEGEPEGPERDDAT